MTEETTKSPELPTPTHALVPLAVLNNIVSYMEKQPFKEVANILNGLVGLQGVTVMPKAPEVIAPTSEVSEEDLKA